MLKKGLRNKDNSKHNMDRGLLKLRRKPKKKYDGSVVTYSKMSLESCDRCQK